jgi:hypothetical protein
MILLSLALRDIGDFGTVQGIVTVPGSGFKQADGTYHFRCKQTLSFYVAMLNASVCTQAPESAVLTAAPRAA